MVTSDTSQPGYKDDFIYQSVGEQPFKGSILPGATVSSTLPYDIGTVYKVSLVWPRKIIYDDSTIWHSK